MSNSRHKGNGGNAFLVVLMLGAAVVSVLGYIFARAGASYKLTRAVMYPVAFMFGQLIAIMVAFCTAFLLSWIVDWQWVQQFPKYMGDLTLYTTLSGGFPKISGGYILVYQFFVWLFFMRPFSRFFTTSIFDSALVGTANRKGVHPYYLRLERIKSDVGYAESCRFYQQTGGGPLLGVVLVWLGRCPPSEFYN